MRQDEILKRCGIYVPRPPDGWYMGEDEELVELIRSLGGGRTRKNYNHMVVEPEDWVMFSRELERERTRIRPACVVLEWGWVEACAEAGKYLGEEDDWGGYLIHAPDPDFPTFRPWVPSGQFKRRREDEPLQDEQGNVIEVEVKRRRKSPSPESLARPAEFFAEYIPSQAAEAAPFFIQPNAAQVSFRLRSSPGIQVQTNHPPRPRRPLAWIPCPPSKTVLALDESDERPVSTFEKIPDGMDVDDDGLAPLSGLPNAGQSISSQVTSTHEVLLDIAPLSLSQTTVKKTYAPAQFTMSARGLHPVAPAGGISTLSPPPPFVLVPNPRSTAPKLPTTEPLRQSPALADGSARVVLPSIAMNDQPPRRPTSIAPVPFMLSTGAVLSSSRQPPISVPLADQVPTLLPLFTSAAPHRPPV